MILNCRNRVYVVKEINFYIKLYYNRHYKKIYNGIYKI